MALFAALTEGELHGLAQRSVEKKFGGDEVLLWEGEPCTGIFLIMRAASRSFALRLLDVK